MSESGAVRKLVAVVVVVFATSLSYLVYESTFAPTAVFEAMEEFEIARAEVDGAITASRSAQDRDWIRIGGGEARIRVTYEVLPTATAEEVVDQLVAVAEAEGWELARSESDGWIAWTASRPALDQVGSQRVGLAITYSLGAASEVRVQLNAL